MSRFLLRLLNRAARDFIRSPLGDRADRSFFPVLRTPITTRFRPWDIIVVGADGSLSTFSPEATEVGAGQYDGFSFGNILAGGSTTPGESPAFQRASADIASGVAACRSLCQYLGVCGGGAPAQQVDGDRVAFRIRDAFLPSVPVQAARRASWISAATQRRLGGPRRLLRWGSDMQTCLKRHGMASSPSTFRLLLHYCSAGSSYTSSRRIRYNYPSTAATKIGNLGQLPPRLLASDQGVPSRAIIYCGSMSLIYLALCV